MRSSPSSLAEAIVGVLLPPACREQVLGDLHERYKSPVQYAAEAIRTVPLVIASRIRRTTDPDVFLMEALGLYVAFLGAALIIERPFLFASMALLRLAIPAAVILAVSTLAAAYANPRVRSPLQPILEAALGVGFAFISQYLLAIQEWGWDIPRWILIAGAAISLLLVSTLRMLFSTAANRPRTATINGPLLWQNTITRLMEYVGLLIVVGSFGAVVLYVVLLFSNRG